MLHFLLNNLLLQSNFSQTPHELSNEVVNSVTNFGERLGIMNVDFPILIGVLVLIIGYFIAKFSGRLLKKLLEKTGIDKQTNSNLSISQFFGKLTYYLVMIIVLMATLNLMGVQGDVLEPLNAMIAKFFSAVPNIIAAGVITYIGYFLAKIVSGLIEASADKIYSWMPKNINFKNDNEFDKNPSEISDQVQTVKNTVNIDLVKILKNVAFIFVFFPILIIALEKLNMQVITHPATNMLDTFINAVPRIVYAIIILFAATVGGRFLSRFIQDLLHSFNVNNLSQKLYLEKVLGEINLVKVISNIAYFFIVYIGISEAAKQLNLLEVVYVMNDVLNVAGKIVYGLLILTLGNFVANYVTQLLLNGTNSNKFSIAIARAAIIVIFLAMGLNAMGIADNIIEMAFGFGIGAIAVAFALSFGLGGREAAGEEVKDFFSKLKKKENK